MTTKAEIVRIIEEDWRESPIGTLCVCIVEYVLTGLDRYKHISYASLMSSCGNGYDPIDIITATQYLCGTRVQVLEIQFEFIDEDDHIYQLSKQEAKKAIQQGIFVHPNTGILLEHNEIKRHIFPYFVPSSTLKKKYAY